MPAARLLFWCTADGSIALLASKLAGDAYTSRGIEVGWGGGRAGAISAEVTDVLREEGINQSETTIPGQDAICKQSFDIVVNIAGDARDMPLCLGHPEVVSWMLDLDDDGDVEHVRQLRDTIKLLLNDFLERGYFDAVLAARRGETLILDNIHDGIIAHDLDRRIFSFNKAAEEITGYKREDVLGKDCHDVFPGNFCGGKCLFCGEKPVNIEPLSRELDIATKSGEKRTVDMALIPMRDRDGGTNAVLASFRDLTREKKLAGRVGEINSFAGIIGRDRAMLDVYELIKDLVDVNVPVLIQGESGTGKELVAAAIHSEGVRGGALFVPVNCGALPEALLESELFGHVKGAFTGAIRDKKGRFELAAGGTIFLDEVGDISPAMQVKLLRVLQEGKFERVGGEKTIQVDVRVVSATNKDLSKEIAAGRFREDLFYRLSVVPLHLPPLRDRRGDIPLLIENVLNRVRVEMNKGHISISNDALDIMMSYDWPGNVRELQNWIQFALIKCHGSVIRASHLPPSSRSVVVSKRNAHGASSVLQRRKNNRLNLQVVEQALADEGGNRVAAARRLGVSHATLPVS